ncbi:MAG: hypothetical protein AAF328_08715 [Planctomycetota bacterium]
MRHSILTAPPLCLNPVCHAALAAISVAALAVLSGCQTDAVRGPSEAPTPNAEAADDAPIVAYLYGQPLRRDALWPALTEAAGGVVFDEFVLDAALQRRLRQVGLTVTAAHVADELGLLADALSDDPDEAARLLAELRQRRGLGDDRFDRLLRRNAALRMLVADDSQLAPERLDAQARRAFAREYGPSFRIRLLTADTPGRAQALRQRVLDGEAFTDLAAQHSTDPSKHRGGLLSPISPADATYPQLLRDTLPQLDPATNAGLSPVLALDGGYAVVQLLETIPARDVAYEAQRDRLLREVQRGNQRLLMEQLAGALREEADVLVIDRDLGRVAE